MASHKNLNADDALGLVVADREARAEEARMELKGALEALVAEAQALATVLDEHPGAAIEVSDLLGRVIEREPIERLARANADLKVLAMLAVGSDATPESRASTSAAPAALAAAPSTGKPTSKIERLAAWTTPAPNPAAPKKANGGKPTLTLSGVAAWNYYSARKAAQTAATEAGLSDLARRIGAAKSMDEVKALASEAFNVEVSR